MYHNKTIDKNELCALLNNTAFYQWKVSYLFMYVQLFGVKSLNRCQFDKTLGNKLKSITLTENPKTNYFTVKLAFDEKKVKRNEFERLKKNITSNDILFRKLIKEGSTQNEIENKLIAQKKYDKINRDEIIKYLCKNGWFNFQLDSGSVVSNNPFIIPIFHNHLNKTFYLKILGYLKTAIKRDLFYYKDLIELTRKTFLDNFITLKNCKLNKFIVSPVQFSHQSVKDEALINDEIHILKRLIDEKFENSDFFIFSTKHSSTKDSIRFDKQQMKNVHFLDYDSLKILDKYGIIKLNKMKFSGYELFYIVLAENKKCNYFELTTRLDLF
jgi:hypothetical protein